LLGGHNHGEGLAGALRVPNEARPPLWVEGAGDDFLHRAGLVLAQDEFVEFVVFAGEEDVITQDAQEPSAIKELLDGGFKG
jgi:hypothetical protein